ncbi:uncharacterized protein LOC114757423 isoform X2 [Neltuma alba]|uniref:uncharacterized protein LOC114757423 isoform X2 n=2 Tax=Neltuma alba TaxID=207710 RepID=UPI0010A44CBF|nr:uncharacterized protein LOC114757423 isoform X2 [Prosopis alba]
MASPKLLVLFIFLLSLIFFHVGANVFAAQGAAEDESLRVNVVDGSDSAPLKTKLDQLNSKIQTLESHASGKTQELKNKDKLVAEKEKIIQDRSHSIESLRNEIASLQKKGALDSEEKVEKAKARAIELEKQADKLQREIETQNRDKVTLETRVIEAEEQIHGLNSKLENLRKINEEQKMQIHKIERALRVSEEEMMRAKFEESSRREELMEVYAAWLPPWLALHWVRCKSFLQTHWNEHGKPALEVITQKFLEKKAQAGKWAEPPVETIKTKWIPAMREQCSVLKTNAEPHMRLLTTKIVEVYEVSKSVVTSHLTSVQQAVDPYYQEAKKLSKPYLDQAAVAAKPHVDRLLVALEPYTMKAMHAYGKFLESATTYHSQVQATVQQTLKEHELTRPFATKEASALLVLPFVLLARVFSAIFCRKAKKPLRNVDSHHPRRKVKRGRRDQ